MEKQIKKLCNQCEYNSQYPFSNNWAKVKYEADVCNRDPWTVNRGNLNTPACKYFKEIKDEKE